MPKTSEDAKENLDWFGLAKLICVAPHQVMRTANYFPGRLANKIADALEAHTDIGVKSRCLSIGDCVKLMEVTDEGQDYEIFVRPVSRLK